MSNVRVTTGANDAGIDAVFARLNVGGSGAIQFYDGTQPPNPNSTITDQIFLFALPLSNPGFKPAVDGVVEANVIHTGLGIAIGNTTWARFVDGNGDSVFDCDVGTVGATINLDSIVIDIDDILGLAELFFTWPSVTP